MGFHFLVTYFTFLLFFFSFIYKQAKSDNIRLTTTPIDRPLFFFLFVMTISVFQTRYISNTPTIIFDAFRNYPWIKGLAGVLMFVLCLVIFYTVIHVIKNKKILKNAIILIISMITLLSLYSLAVLLYTYITGLHLPMFFDPLLPQSNYALRLKSIFTEPLYFGNYLLSTLPVVFCLAISKSQYLNRRFIIFSFLILTASLILTVSRGAWFGFLVFLLLFIIIYKQSIFSFDLQKKVIKACFFVTFVVAVFIFTNAYLMNNRINTEIYDGSKKVLSSITDPVLESFNPHKERFWSTRVRLWTFKYAWEGFKEHPLLGVGYSNYPFYSGNKYHENLFYFSINFPEVNNYPFQIFTEMGVIGFSVLIWLFITIILTAVRSIRDEYDKEKRDLLTGYFLAFVAVSAHTIFFSNLIYAYLWVMLAILISLSKTKEIIVG